MWQCHTDDFCTADFQKWAILFFFKSFSSVNSFLSFISVITDQLLADEFQRLGGWMKHSVLEDHTGDNYIINICFYF